MRAGVLALLLLLAVPVRAAPPCSDAVAVGDRVSVSVGCVRWCATAATVTVPQLRAELAHCRAMAVAAADEATAMQAACERQVEGLRQPPTVVELERPPPWYASPWLWGAVGAVAGGAAVWAVRR